jgi:hypothetical protein
MDEKEDDRFRFWCRPAAFTRIAENSGAADAAGWPEEIRDIRLQGRRMSRRRQELCCRCKRMSRSFSGQQVRFEAPSLSRIRAGGAVRHENHNRK